MNLTCQVYLRSLLQGHRSRADVKVNTIDILETNWQGYYFPSVPIQVKAIHSDGFEFGYWLEFPDSSSTMKLDIQDAMTLTAVFLPLN